MAAFEGSIVEAHHMGEQIGKEAVAKAKQMPTPLAR
jgi:hypothetical protein